MSESELKMFGRYRGHGDAEHRPIHQSPSIIVKCGGDIRLVAVPQKIFDSARRIDDIIYNCGVSIDCNKVGQNHVASRVAISPKPLDPKEPDPVVEDETFIPIEDIQIDLFVANSQHRVNSIPSVFDNHYQT